MFCIHIGQTIEESDATVFFSQKQLFAHLARHPRPLPHLQGVTVIEGDMPPALRNNYDLHLKNPVELSPLAGKRVEITGLPTATSRETVRRMHGMRMLPDRTEGIEFDAGARIVGIRFPSKYNGEWCMGWHDGKYGAFPTETVRFEPPAQAEIRLGNTSTSARAVARWKFHPKDKDKGDWLKFDKGEVISNIACKLIPFL